MTVEEIELVLYAAADVRMPRFVDDLSPRERVTLLEDYLNLTAVTRADLERARLHAQAALKTLTDQWEQVPAERKRTLRETTEAKALVAPELHEGIKQARWLIARLGEQIDRLSHMGDDQVASRMYTLITGS
jgi:hypothetical protein